MRACKTLATRSLVCPLTHYSPGLPAFQLSYYFDCMRRDRSREIDLEIKALLTMMWNSIIIWSAQFTFGEFYFDTEFIFHDQKEPFESGVTCVFNFIRFTDSNLDLD